MAKANESSNGGESRRSDRKWYKDRIYIFILGVFAIAALIVFLRAETKNDNEISVGNEAALLVGSNKSLSGINSTILIVNKTALLVEKGIPPIIPTSKTLDEIKDLLQSVNNTLSNPKISQENTSNSSGVRDLLQSINQTMSDNKTITSEQNTQNVSAQNKTTIK